jgi:hypothetical protein
LGPGILDAEHEVADDVAVELDDDGGRQPHGVGEALPVGLEVGGDLGEPLADGLEAPVLPRRVGVVGACWTEHEPLGTHGLRERWLGGRARGGVRAPVACDGEQRQQWGSEVAYRGEDAVELGLVDEGTGQGGGAVVASGEAEVAEDGGPVVVEVADHPQLVGGGGGGGHDGAPAGAVRAPVR